MKKSNGRIKVNRISTMEIMRKYGIKRMFVFFVLALFFAVLIIVYNTLLTSYIKDSILARNELNAIDSAKNVENYLSTGKNVIDVTEYNVNKMVESGASGEEILEYLTEYTNSYQNSVLPATTGLYGCIDGKYYDGSGWVPDADYVPTERPWYTEAIADRGNTVLINPYFDLYSEEVVMTIAKSLSNGRDVVAVDITLGHIQEITEEGLKGDDNTSRMIISSNGFVVAHTDPGERGKNYLEDKYTLGGFILQKISRSEDDVQEIEYLGKDYIVYSVPVGKDWNSISVTESDNVYRPVRRMLIAAVLAIFLTYIIFTIMMIRSGRSMLVNNNLQSILNSSADIYMSLCDLDVINNTVVGIKNKNPAIAKIVEAYANNMQEGFNSIMTGLPDSPTKQVAVEFSDLSNIDERMRETDIATIEYISYGGIWVRARYVVSERTPDGRVSHLLWMLENIDKEKKEREDLIDMSERAWAASEAKSAFLSSMSHEIRTPINAVLGLNEMVLRESTDDNIKNYAKSIKSSGRMLLGLVNDILDFSKIESGKMEIVPVEYDMASIINDLVNMIKLRTEAKGLRLILDIDRKLPQKLYGDDVRLKQIITNLLTNAVKYTEKGSVTLSMSHTKKDEKNIILHVKVKDTGIGIRKEDMKKLFSEFERIDEKRNRNIEGTGLGMSITKSLLALMNSSVNVESEYGKGSQFSFDLVQEVVDDEPIGDYEETFRKSLSDDKDHESYTAETARILVTDDNYVNLFVVKSLLKDTKIEIDTAQSGDEAIALAKKNKYDIIFLDHMMPGKDGIETLEELKASEDNINRDIPYICLTANAVTGARKTYIESGFDDYLTKPIDLVLLNRIMTTYLPEDKIIRS